MLEYLIGADMWLFLTINHLPHNFFLNNFFAAFSGVGIRIVIWFIIGVMLLLWEEKKDKRGLLAQFIACILSFLIISFSLKNYFQRIRPEFRLSETLVILDRVSDYSFPSSHASFAFAMVYILSRHHKNRKKTAVLYSVAYLIAFSRVYLGKHYPSDVFAGMLLGTGIGFVSYNMSLFIAKHYKKYLH